MRRTFQEIMQEQDYEALIKKFAAVKKQIKIQLLPKKVY